jgi:hypothetical protein
MRLQSKRERYYYSLDSVYIYDTSEFIKNKLPEIPPRITVKVDRLIYQIGSSICIFAALLQLILIEWKIPEVLFILIPLSLGTHMIIKAFSERLLVLDDRGITINNKRFIKWGKIIRTEMEEIIQSESNSYVLVIHTEKDTIDFDMENLSMNYKELAVYLEAFKNKYSKKL